MMAIQQHDCTVLVAHMATGNSREALELFYARYASTVLGLLTKMLGSRAEAEEVLQDVFVELWQRAPQYDPARGSVVAWVVMVARSRALDALRARARRHADRREQVGETHAIGGTSGRPDVLASSTRWHQALRRAFGELNDEQRAVLELSYFCGKSHVEIADTLNLPLGTVKSRILSGMRALRATLPGFHRSIRSE